MKKYLFFSLILFTGLSISGKAQNLDQMGENLPSLTPDEQLVLSGIPQLEVPAKYRGPDAPLLPFSIDNSTQPYFRPIGGQSGYECGQSAGIGYNFTYEVNRLRNVPSNTTVNQYPSHFTWDFLNNGDNYTGASCFDSWEIVRACGTMNVADYGGAMNTGGYLRWITGYDKYYNGMANRINYMRSVRCDTPEGLETLKYWLFDHLEGAAIGGVATFYGNYFGPTLFLPTGTPEAGKYVITSWGSSPSHTWTVCGYNDSIRYDYNNDGQYTNNIDINGDGVVNMKDWEIGGLKFANGYAGTGWGNSGFCYLMYKNLADAIGFGGIWNHTLYVIDVKQSCGTRMAMKVTLKHNSRNKLKITTGISANMSATVPSYVQEYPIFKYQGGDHYMQGGTTEAEKTIEFGLDLDPLLNQISSGQPAKFFLQVQEADPSSSATGEITSWSLIDYTSGAPVATNYPTGNVPIANNTTTRLSINYTASFVKPDITTSSLPPANLYQPYSCQLTAANSSTPYLWDLQLDYPETVSPSAFPTVNAQQLTVSNSNSGYAIKTLPFTFPFYKKAIDKLYIYADGYILFDDQLYTWPYIIDKNLLFCQTAIISPFMADLNLYSAQSDGIWYQEEASAVTIRWKASIYNMSGTSGLNFAVKLYKSGKIEFYYGNMNYPVSTAWTGGISGGDNKNYQFSSMSGAATITANTLDQYAACGFPVEMSLSDDGLFTGIPDNAYTNQPIRFRVNDNHNISNTRILNFSTNGLLLSYTILSGGDSIIEFGETANVNLKITNIGNQTVHNVNTWLTESDPFILLTDSTAYAGDILAGQTLNLTSAFAFAVSPLIPDDHAFSSLIHVTSTEHSFNTQMNLLAFAPGIQAGEAVVLDGDNGWLDPGETTDIRVTYKNFGGAKAQNLAITLLSNDPYLTINVSAAALGTLKPDSSANALFNVTAAPDAPFEHLYRMGTSLTAANGYLVTDSLFLFSGEIIEDFESGTMTKFPWFTGGFGYWYADGLEHYEGSFCTRSGWIYDNQESSLNLNVNVLAAGPISFMKKVSCEDDPGGTNYDYLAFFIDNTEMGRWDGIIDWSRETFSVTKGYHTFKWVYHKDYSVSSYSDCAWLDFITFPTFAGGYPVLAVSPDSFEKTFYVGTTGSDQLIITNAGGGIMDYSVMVFDTTANKKSAPDNLSGSYLECYTDGFIPGEAFTWTFVLHNGSPDNEYVKEMKIDVPPGVTINTATNFAGGSLGELVFTGTPGNGTSLLWHGESSGGLGVVKPGETATTVLTGFIGENFTGDAFMVYAIRGDGNGVIPHETSGYVKLKNFSIPNGWLTLGNNIGTILHGQSETADLTFDATNLIPPVDLTCDVIVKDKFNNKKIIPVLMHVLDTTIIIGTGNLSNPFNMRNYPNPFSGATHISYQLNKKQQVKVYITDFTGRAIRRLLDKFQDHGRYDLLWDGKNDAGITVASGIYYLQMSAGEQSGYCKMIRIHP